MNILSHEQQTQAIAALTEGVEDAAALDHLREQGCDYAQGFHISHPLPVDACARTIRPVAEAPISSAPFPVA